MPGIGLRANWHPAARLLPPGYGELRSSSNWAPPVPSPDQQFFGGSDIIQLKAHAQGRGGLWDRIDGDESQADAKSLMWQFAFTPQQSGIFEFSALIFFKCHYILTADDGDWTSCEAFGELVIGTNPSQQVTGPVQPARDFRRSVPAWRKGWSGTRGDDNIDADGPIALMDSIQSRWHLVAGFMTTVYVWASVVARAKGDGSEAVMCFGDPGEGLALIGCAVTPLHVY